MNANDNELEHLGRPDPQRGPRIHLPPGVSRRTVTRSALLGLTVLISGRIAATAQAVETATDDPVSSEGITLRLPPPTGPHRVGVTPLYLVDPSRADPWDSSIPVRELMISVFYPARSVHGFPRAPQLTTATAALFAAFAPVVDPGLPTTGVNWAATMSHAYLAAPAQPMRCPVLLFSPAAGHPRALGTATAVDLASHGYLVVTIDHPGDAIAVEFPGTTPFRRSPIRRTALRASPRTDPALFRTLVETRLADVRFALDRLATLAAGDHLDQAVLPENLCQAMDLRRIGMYGHSAGGTTAAEAMYEDRRIRAAITLEGYLDHPPTEPGRAGELFPVARHGVDRPLLLVNTDGFADRSGMERSWSELITRSGGRARQRRIDQAAHGVFTDYAALVPQLQAAGLVSAADRTTLIGAMAASRSVPLVRHLVRSFFEVALVSR